MRLAVCLIICLSFSFSICQAADIDIVRPEPSYPTETRIFQPSDCNIKLSGPIVQGDVEKLKALGTMNEGKIKLMGTLCLNSTGGSYKEGLEIAEFLLDQDLTTIVIAGDVCDSACALIFMTGGDWQDGRAWYRYLQPDAELGFHAPYITRLPDQLYTKEEMQQVYNFAIKSIRDLTRLGQQHHVPDSFLPTPILAELLDKGPTEVFLVDTVYKAAQLKIDLNGAGGPKATPDALYNACLNLLVRADRGITLDSPPRVTKPIKYNKQAGGVLSFSGFGPEALQSCIVRLPGEFGTPYDILTRLVPTGHQLSADDVFVRGKEWWLNSPDTRLK